MPKSERERQDRREKEQAYTARFLERLLEASTLAGARALAQQDIPGQSSTGRLRHTNLLHFLGAFRKGSGGSHSTLDRNYPLVPGGATASERHAYAALVSRLVVSGDLEETDAALARDALLKAGAGFVDLI